VGSPTPKAVLLVPTPAAIARTNATPIATPKSSIIGVAVEAGTATAGPPPPPPPDVLPPTPEKALGDDVGFMKFNERFLSYWVNAAAWNKYMPDKAVKDAPPALPIKKIGYLEVIEFAGKLTVLLHKKFPQYSEWVYRIPTKEDWESARDLKLTDDKDLAELVTDGKGPIIVGGKDKPEHPQAPPAKEGTPETVFRVVLEKRP
jgi:hypothetical protein